MLKMYDVTVPGFGSEIVNAESSGDAKGRAWRSDAFLHLSFKEFLRSGVSAKLRTSAPSPDGYDYVRRTYGADVRIGMLVSLADEGPEWNGRLGKVMYPGPSTASVSVLIDGMNRPLSVHPNNVRIVSANAETIQ